MSLVKQTEILGSISNIIHNSCAENYDSASCVFEIFGEGLEKTASSSINYSKLGTNYNPVFDDNALFDVTDYVVELHTLMKEHTGGEWTSFTLTLDVDGKATTKFTYPESYKTKDDRNR